ncbi:hypothetical protein Tco_0719801 [Tanacetum coccineum]
MRNRFFIGGELDEKKITWVKWNTFLASKATGGLGIGSAYALNAALLFMWIWRFRCSPNDLWVKVIKEIHGSDGAICSGRLDKSSQSPWNAILRSVHKLQSRGIDLLAACYRSCTVAQRISSLDWNSVLRRSPRGGVELNQFTAMLEAIRDINLSDSIDGWKWALDSKGFTVSSVQKFIDEQTLIGGFTSSRWLRCIPIKVNVFMWRPKSKNAKVRVNTEESAVKPEPELKNTIECNLNPSDGPGKPNSLDFFPLSRIELEHKVAKLLKENETLKRHYKEMKMGFAIAALKNELRKLTGNSVNTKFVKSSILGKSVLQPRRNQSVVRQLTAFKSERPRSSRPWFAYQVDVNNDLSKPVTTHYFPKKKESAVVKPHHMIAPSSSRYNSNDMVHNHYLG